MSALRKTAEDDCYTRAANEDYINGGPRTRTKYLYDEFGHRIVKTVNGRNLLFVYGQNGELLEESDGSYDSTLKDYYYLQGRLVAFYWAGGPQYAGMSYAVHSDRLGAPQTVTDEHNKVVWNAAWNPYGDIRSLTSSVTLNIRYPGQYYDAETGFIQNGMREYIPQWGRYMEEDPLGLAVDENVRAYVSNRPTRYLDPSGMEANGFMGVPFTGPYADIPGISRAYEQPLPPIDENQPGPVFNVTACDLGCISITVNGAGNVYLGVGIGEGVSCSLLAARNMHDSSNGGTVQGTGGYLSGSTPLPGMDNQALGGQVPFSAGGTMSITYSWPISTVGQAMTSAPRPYPKSGPGPGRW